MTFSLDQILDYVPDAAALDSPAIQTLMSQGNFINEASALAVVSCGGTLSSTYLPEDETITSTSSNVGLNTIRNMQKLWGVTSDNVTGISLISKDSRDFTANDVVFLLNFLNAIKNKRILVTAGTYIGPLFAEAANRYVLGEKTIGFTGSRLPAAIVNNDVDANIFGTLAAINMYDGIRTGRDPFVFFHFHGEIFKADRLTKIDLHPKAKYPTAVAGAIERTLVRKTDL